MRREQADYKRFIGVLNKNLVLYSQGSGFYKYYKNVIEYLLGYCVLDSFRWMRSGKEKKYMDLRQRDWWYANTDS